MIDKDKYVLQFSNDIGWYFNGIAEEGHATISPMSRIYPENTFSSYKEACRFMNTIPEAKPYFNIVRVVDIPLKPRNKYQRLYSPMMEISTGNGKDVCGKCGITILSGEEYISYFYEKVCLHCAILKLEKILLDYDRINDDLKTEWEKNGKKEVKELCSGFILKDEAG